ncbi:DUF262 domain-containing protein [Maribacter arcticus]|uniref:GmrSD restriction endonucleases N-terminal domain-containing protein n=1 Tax=Maribacter arcticus TaxID=561365 RepID=A0A1T5AJ32_9FLAO|nr:DUF262 domain-containing protein [Maribacter arcticus]SKB34966.1 Protein of unknown function DUF262 [Maribacter arcticus]
MSYHSKTIKQAVKDIESEKTFLPAIQRKFVWPRHKIEYLFDSLMRNFPIGSFLFWELKSEKAYDYVFYNFLRKYDERKPNNERKTGSFLNPEIIGVLDGQQRLSSMYLGLQGTHRERLKYHRSLQDYAYPETALYLNLLTLPYYINNEGDIDIEREIDFEFRFLTQEEAKHIKSKNNEGIWNKSFWFKVGDVLRWSDDPEIDEIFEALKLACVHENQTNAFNKKKRLIKKGLRDLHKRICEEELINYFKVTKDDLDDILKIFIRVNSGGTILSKTDLLFSTIVATWEDGRDEIEAFLKDLNSKGDGFWFNNDFLMRSCLVLSDLPVLFKVNSFKSKNVQLVKDNWENIKSALEKTVNLLESFGFSGSVLTSQNSVIVIAYHFMKGGNTSETSKQGIKKYLLHALLKNVYGGQGDQVITSFRNALREEVVDKENKESSKEKTYQLKQSTFPFDVFLDLKLPANKTLKITEEDIEEFLNYRKSANSFFVLALLYPHLRFNQVHFHQDHIHPHSRFSDAKLRDVGIPEDKWQHWQSLKDTIPNLQLMEGRENSSKNATQFKDWFEGSFDGNKNVNDPVKFREDNFIPSTSLEFSNFETFYTERKVLITSELMKVLNLKKKQEQEQEISNLSES